MSFFNNSSENSTAVNTNNSSLVNSSYPQCVIQESESTAAIIGKIGAYSILLLVALCGNVILTYVVFKNKLLGKPINCFVVNMAISDMLIPLFVIPRKIIEVMTGSAFKWLINGIPGQILCKFVFFVQDVSIAVSVFSLICIAMDRFTAVVFPFQRGLFNSRLRAFLIATSWLLAAVMFAPYLYAFKLLPGPDGEPICTMNWEPAFENVPTTKRYSMAVLIVTFIIPFIVLAVLYSMIWIHLKKPGLRLLQKSGRARRERRNRNVLKMALAIVASFALCWVPFNVYVFLVIFVWDWRPPFCLPETFQFVMGFMGFANSAINPCIYFIFVENFRTSLQRMLSRSFSHSSLTVKVRTSKRREIKEAIV